ncbi:MAG TPA: hypothetical protein VF532_16065 [Candidatus Angelobacter sp.]
MPAEFAQENPAARPKQHNSTGVSVRELARLRPVVKRDLKKVLQRTRNINTPSAAELENEFQQCRFTPLQLGRLGRAVLVQDQSDGGKNVLLLNIYVPSRGSYRLLISEAGVGPLFLPGPGYAPDIIFGTAGVCYSLARYRYIAGKYQLDACIERQRDEHDNCVVKSCGKPSFPDPFVEDAEQKSDSSPAPSPYFTGPGLTGKEIMSVKK